MFDALQRMNLTGHGIYEYRGPTGGTQVDLAVWADMVARIAGTVKGGEHSASLHPEGIRTAWCRTPFWWPLPVGPALTFSAWGLAETLLPLEELAQGASRDTPERGCGCGGRSWPGSSRKTVALP